MNDVDDNAGETRLFSGREALTGTHLGPVRVVSGSLFVAGLIDGTVRFDSGTSGVIGPGGSIEGALYVAGGAEVEIRGAQQGAVCVEAGGVLRIGRSGALFGTMQVDGRLENQGARGGAVSGSGDVVDLDGSEVRRQLLRDGITYWVE